VSAVRYRGIRFITSAGEGEGSGLRVDAKGDLETVEDDSAVRQAILLLIATRPGERVMRPAYGCDLQRLVFSPNDDTTAGLAITLDYRVRATQRRDLLVVRFSLGTAS
jgi:hypothetical protein